MTCKNWLDTLLTVVNWSSGHRPRFISIGISMNGGYERAEITAPMQRGEVRMSWKMAIAKVGDG